MSDARFSAADRASAFADRYRPPAHEGAFPTDGLAELHRLGLTTAPLAPDRGGSALGVAADRWGEMLAVCRHLGRADLSLARLYEGHVNGVQLVETFGSDELKDRFAAAIRGGALSAIWNTERPGHALALSPVPAPQTDDSSSPRVALAGGKVFCSGAAHVARPVICGTLAGPRGGWQMAVVPMEETPHAVDPAGWDPLGVRGTGTYSIRFDPGATVPASNLVGAPGDYLREPWLTAGAARFLAVQVGAGERLLELVRSELWLAKRTDHPGQRGRVAELTRLIARGSLWLDGLGERVAAWLDRPGETDRLVAFTRAARTEIEELSHDVIRLAAQCLGLRSMVAPHPLERALRDLTTYLRQPALDTSVEGVGRFALDGSHGLFAQELFDPAAPAPCPNRRLRGTPLERPETLPERPVDWLRTFGRTAVLAPHPDDESLGVGGVIARLVDLGLPVGVCCLTDGEASHPGSRTHPPRALAALRREEARAACAALGVNHEAVRFLSLPDGNVPRAGTDGFDAAADALRSALGDLPGGPPHTLLVPWRREPHGDHRAARDLAAAVAGRARVIEYPVHFWQTRDPADVPRFLSGETGDEPGEVEAVRVDVAAVRDRKRAAIDAHRSQTTDLIADSPAGFVLPEAWRAACDRPFEVLLLPPDRRPTDSVSPDYFAAKYAAADDPWDYVGSDYEAAKHDATLAAPPRDRYRRGLELGCSIGVLTERLAARCDRLRAVDAAADAVARCRDRCRDLGHVTAEVAVLPADWPAPAGDRFDLIVASEVCYYWSDADFALARRRILESLEPGGTLLLVHWTVFVPDYPRTGDAVHEAFLREPGLRHVVGSREPFYRLDVFERAD